MAGHQAHAEVKEERGEEGSLFKFRPPPSILRDPRYFLMVLHIFPSHVPSTPISSHLSPPLFRSDLPRMHYLDMLCLQ